MPSDLNECTCSLSSGFTKGASAVGQNFASRTNHVQLPGT